MRVYHHPRDLLCAHSACGCPEQPSPAFTFMFGRCQNRNLPTGYKGMLYLSPYPVSGSQSGTDMCVRGSIGGRLDHGHG